MQNGPLVSVVTPVRNGGEYLAECIESVLSQSYGNWEYVIVNNSSTDDTLEIASSYASRDARIRVHDNAEPLPLLGNWNHALRQISGGSSYCKVVHADDWLYPTCLEKMVSLAEANPEVGIVGALRMKGDRVAPSPDTLRFSESVLDGRSVCRRSLLGGPDLFGSPTTLLIRSELIRSRDAFYNESYLHADTEACFEVLASHDFGYVHEVLTYSRVHESSVTSGHASLGTLMLHHYHMARRFGPAYLSGDALAARLRYRSERYHAFLCTLLLTGRWSAWRYHRKSLRALGYEVSSVQLLEGLRWSILRCASNPLAATRALLARPT